MSAVAVLRDAAVARPERRSAFWAAMPSYLFLAAVALLTVGYVTDPASGRGALFYSLISLPATAAIVVGIVRYKPAVRLPWILMTGVPVLGSAGMALRLTVAPTSTLMAVLPDIVTIPGYLLLLAGMLRLVRARQGTTPGTALDGGLMAVAALVVSWSVLITPVFRTPDMPLVFKLVGVAYPTISVAVLFVAVLLAMNEVTKIPAFWRLGVAWVGLLLGDVVYALASIGTNTLPLWAANLGYCAFFGLLGSAALHPSMAMLSDPTAKRVKAYGHSRFLAVAVALVLPAAIVALRVAHGTGERLVDAALLGGLGVLVFARMARAVSRHAQSEVRLERLAHHDPLTGMPNRLQLESHLAAVLGQAKRGLAGVGVIYLDLDAFKNVNDNWGHETGDALLRVVAVRIRSALCGTELAARVGGDEFIVVCSELGDAGAAGVVAERILSVLDEPVSLGGCEINIGASAGLAFAAPADVDVTPSDLLREADTAMYRSKLQGRHAPVLFDESMRTEIAERIELETALRGALERGELELHYQPLVDLRSGETCGFEALMRWHHPLLGSVPPDRFIPIAEDTGLILKLGRWAIEEATAKLALWRAEFGLDLSMSVNLSAHQMHDPDLIATVERALTASAIPAGSLCLEITERTVMDDLDSTIAALQALKGLGVRLSADDFGTGYSSLAYLRRFPFDEVKVDRSFVQALAQDNGAAVIVGAVVSMARALSLSTVAEGVETDRQRTHLLALGATRGQGWLYSRPLPAPAVREHLALAQPDHLAVTSLSA